MGGPSRTSRKRTMIWSWFVVFVIPLPLTFTNDSIASTACVATTTTASGVPRHPRQREQHGAGVSDNQQGNTSANDKGYTTHEANDDNGGVATYEPNDAKINTTGSTSGQDEPPDKQSGWKHCEEGCQRRRWQGWENIRGQSSRAGWLCSSLFLSF